MRKIKKAAVSILSCLLIALFPLSAYATEAGETGTGDAAAQCNVTFAVTDGTESGYPGTSLTIVMTDITGTVTDTYTLAKAASWGSGGTPTYTVTAPTTYSVEIEGLADGYEVVSDSGSFIFAAPSQGEVTLTWTIIDSGTDAGAASSGSTSSEAAETSGTEADTSADEPGTSTAPEGAEEVFQALLGATAFMEDDEAWAESFLGYYDLNMYIELYGERYTSYVSGGTQEEWEAMSLYERFVWAESYLRFAYASASGHFDEYYGSEENFEESVTSLVTVRMELQEGYEEVEAAYLALADWQWAYVLENGVPYNFLNGTTYLEEIAAEPVAEEETKEEITEDTEEEEVIEETEETEAEEETEEEEGIWSDTLDELAGNLVALIIAAGLACAVGVVVYKRKQMNLDDDTDSDSSMETTDDR